jgi:hypothetical protein
VPAAPIAVTPVLAPTPAEDPNAPAEPKTKRNSTGMMVAGITMISIAPVALLVAAVAAGQKSSCKRYPDEYYFDPVTGDTGIRTRDCDGYDATIYGFTIGGIALFAAGIPLFVVGSRKVPVENAAGAATPGASLSPWISKNGGGATLELRL